MANLKTHAADCALESRTSDWGDFWASLVEILVFPSPTGYMLTSSGFPSLNWCILYKIPLKWSVIFLQSPNSTGYFSNSTGSFETNCRFSLIIEQNPVRTHPHDTSNQWCKATHCVTITPVKNKCRDACSGVSSWYSKGGCIWHRSSARVKHLVANHIEFVHTWTVINIFLQINNPPRYLVWHK